MGAQQHEPPMLRGTEGRLGFLARTHFPDKDGVWCLPQGFVQTLLEAVYVRTDLALAYQALGRPEHVLDRLFDRHCVDRPGVQHLLQDGRHRGRLAGTGGTADDNQTTVGRHQLAHQHAQTELGKIRNGFGQLADDHLGLQPRAGGEDGAAKTPGAQADGELRARQRVQSRLSIRIGLAQPGDYLLQLQL